MPTYQAQPAIGQAEQATIEVCFKHVKNYFEENFMCTIQDQYGILLVLGYRFKFIFLWDLKPKI